MPRRKLRTPELREHVLRTAQATLADGGIEGLTARRLAARASTSVPAVYELFGDKGGVVREIFFSGFRQLGAELAALPASTDPRRDLTATVAAFRAVVVRQPELAHVMFGRPFSDFDPGPDERAAGSAVRDVIVGRVRRAVDAGLLRGDPIDIAHVVLALAQGLAAQEVAGWLGTSRPSVDRRWRDGVAAVLDGFAR